MIGAQQQQHQRQQAHDIAQTDQQSDEIAENEQHKLKELAVAATSAPPAAAAAAAAAEKRVKYEKKPASVKQERQENEQQQLQCAKAEPMDLLPDWSSSKFIKPELVQDAEPWPDYWKVTKAEQMDPSLPQPTTDNTAAGVKYAKTAEIEDEQLQQKQEEIKKAKALLQQQHHHAKTEPTDSSMWPKCDQLHKVEPTDPSPPPPTTVNTAAPEPMVKAEPVSHQESAAAPTLMQSQCTTAAAAAGITAAASIAGLHKVEPPDPSPPPPTTVNTAAPEPVVKAEPVLHQESAAAPTLMQSQCTTISDDEPVSHQESAAAPTLMQSQLTTAFAAAAVLCPQAAAAAAAAGITATSIAASPELSTAAPMETMGSCFDTPACGTEQSGPAAPVLSTGAPMETMGSCFATPACGTEQSGPAAPVLDNWRTQIGDNRDLENCRRQVPNRSGKMRKRGARSDSPNVEGAHARDASKVRCTKSSSDRLSDECVKTLLRTNNKLAQMCCGLSEILKCQIDRTTDMQQALGGDAAMTAASSAQHALATEQCNMISAASDEVVKSVSATLGQLELLSTAGSATSVSHLATSVSQLQLLAPVSGNQCQSVGLDRVESSF